MQQNLRPIDATGFTPIKTPAETPAPQLQWIKIEQLVVDDDYQREITNDRRKAIRQIAENFDWRYFSTVMVSPIEGGLYAVIDGQGRTTAAKLCGMESVPCAVIIATKAEQARAFAAVNGAVVVVRPLQRFKALVAGGDPEAMKIKALADRAGVIIAASAGGVRHKRARPNETFALDVIRRGVAKYGEQTMEIALRACAKSCGATGGHIRHQMIAAVARVLHDEPSWRDQPDLDATFAAIKLEELWREAMGEAQKISAANPTDILAGAIIDALFERYDNEEAA